MILFDAGFANTFLHIMPGVEIRAMYEIIVSHALEQGCVMENTQKIKIKLENIWIDLIRSIYVPYSRSSGKLGDEKRGGHWHPT